MLIVRSIKGVCRPLSTHEMEVCLPVCVSGPENQQSPLFLGPVHRYWEPENKEGLIYIPFII